jgi:hypothetical protein
MAKKMNAGLAAYLAKKKGTKKVKATGKKKPAFLTKKKVTKKK